MKETCFYIILQPIAMKRILIITYYWPPSGGGGVQRWLKMAKYLPQHGWQPVIYTPHDPYFHVKDPTLLHDVPAEAEVIKQPIWEPYRLYDKLLNKKGNGGGADNAGLVKGGRPRTIKEKIIALARSLFFIPDPRCFWVRPSIKYLTQYLKANPVDAVVTTGPPHSMHLIGQGLKQRLGVYWVADFRDLWTQLDILQQFGLSQRALRRHAKLERAVLQQANEVLMVNHQSAKALESIAGRPVSVIHNGFDTTDFKQPKPIDGNTFYITHFGLLNNFRNPEKLWAVLDELCQEQPAFFKALNLRLGGVTDPSIQAQINSYPYLKQRVSYHPYVSHTEVIDIYYESALLLLCINNTHLGKMFMTGKIFEYLAVERRVLAFGPPQCDAGQLLQSTGAGTMFGYDQHQAVKQFVWQAFQQYPNMPGAAHPDKVQDYTRKNLTAALVSLLNNGLNCTPSQNTSTQ